MRAVITRVTSASVAIDGETVGRKPTEKHRAEFVLRYAPGTIRAVGLCAGSPVSEDALETAGEAAEIRLVPERTVLPEDGTSLAYVAVEIRDGQGRPVPDAALKLHAEVTGAGTLAGFGSADPRARDTYSTGEFNSWRGRALAVVRAGTESGAATLTVRGGGMEASTKLIYGGEDHAS